MGNNIEETGKKTAGEGAAPKKRAVVIRPQNSSKAKNGRPASERPQEGTRAGGEKKPFNGERRQDGNRSGSGERRGAFCGHVIFRLYESMAGDHPFFCGDNYVHVLFQHRHEKDRAVFSGEEDYTGRASGEAHPKLLSPRIKDGIGQYGHQGAREYPQSTEICGEDGSHPEQSCR